MTTSCCLFGDSIASGIILDKTRNKYLFLKDWLKKLGSELKIANYARFGCTITRGRDIIKKHLDTLKDYEYTVLEFGGNDCDFDWAAIAQNPNASHRAKTPVTQFMQNYSEIIDEVKSHNGQPLLVTLPPIDSQKYFNWVSQGLNADNILIFLGEKQEIYRWHEMYNNSILELAKIHSVPLIDIRSEFLSTKNFSEYLCEDGIHPNAAGYSLIEATVDKYVKKN